MTDRTLADLLRATAAELEDVEATETADGLEWRIDGRLFATLAGRSAEFRLDPQVARAAMRTPDTATSGRGADWVAFAPATLDGHAADRASAWLTSAWRRADGEG